VLLTSAVYLSLGETNAAQGILFSWAASLGTHKVQDHRHCYILSISFSTLSDNGSAKGYVSHALLLLFSPFTYA
jgi:hypothetical protein